MCHILRLPLLTVWSLKKSQAAPVFSGIVDPPEFCGALQPYCVLHRCAIAVDDQGGMATCPMKPDRDLLE